MTHIFDGIKATPANSLLAGYESTVGSDRNAWQYAVLRGTPAGLRMLARILDEMADTVDASGDGWHLAFSPDDIPALLTANVRNLAVDCTTDMAQDVLYYANDASNAPQDGG